MVSLYNQVLIACTNQTFHAAAGSSCGAVGRVVATSTRDHWFESQHQQKHIETFVNCNLLRNDELNKELKRITQICNPDVFPKFKSKLIGDSCKGVIAQLYGAPGSGKTELIKKGIIAAALNKIYKKILRHLILFYILVVNTLVIKKIKLNKI